MTRYPPTSMFIHYARDYYGDKRLRHVGNNLNVPFRILKKYEKKIKPVLEFVKKIDITYHDLLENTENTTARIPYNNDVLMIKTGSFVCIN